MYVSSRLKNHILATRKTRKGVTLYVKLNFEPLLIASISFATLNMYFVDRVNFASVKIKCSHSLETRESRALPCIFSEHMPLCLFNVKFMFYVESNNFCELENTAELKDFFC